MKIIILIILSFITLNAQSRIIPFSSNPAGTVGGGFDPSDLNPVLDLRWNAGTTVDGNQVTAWADGTISFTVADTANAPTLTDSCIWFRPTLNRYLARADNNDLLDVGTGDFTIELWIWADALSQRIFYQPTAPYIRYTHSDNDGYKATLTMDNSGTPATFSLPSATDVTGAWNHIVVVADRNVGCYIYLNGELDASNTTSAWTDFSTVDMNSGGSTLIGRFDGGNGFGRITDLRLYHTALTSTNVDDLFAFGRTQ